MGSKNMGSKNISGLLGRISEKSILTLSDGKIFTDYYSNEG